MVHGQCILESAIYMKADKRTHTPVTRRTFNKGLMAGALTTAASSSLLAHPTNIARHQGDTKKPRDTVLYNGWVLTPDDLSLLELDKHDL